VRLRFKALGCFGTFGCSGGLASRGALILAVWLVGCMRGGELRRRGLCGGSLVRMVTRSRVTRQWWWGGNTGVKQAGHKKEESREAFVVGSVFLNLPIAKQRAW